MPETRPISPDLHRSENRTASWLLIAGAVYLLRVIGWSMAELWYDEILTLQHFAITQSGQGPWWILRNYYLANNHFLTSIVYWWWVRFLDFNMAEHVLRLPSLACGFAGLAVVICHWRIFLGRRFANLGGCLLAASPVYGAFAYQVRGYSLSMLLSIVALSGVLEIRHGQRRRGQLLFCLACFLQPLGMPSAVMMVPALAAFLFWTAWREQGRLAPALRQALPGLLAGVLAAAYYLTLGEQFARSGREAGGWESGWRLAGHVWLAFALHLGLFAVPLLLACWQAWRGKGRQAPPAEGVALAVAAALIMLPLMFWRFGDRVPFPRVFLVMLPVLTCAALQTARISPFFRQTRIFYLATAVLLSGSLVESVCTDLTRRALRAGAAPQNLLMQYYRGSDDNRAAVAFLQESGLAPGSLVLVNAYDAPSFSFYWELQRLPLAAVKIANRVEPGFWRRYPEAMFMLQVVARNAEEAGGMFQLAGYHGRFHRIYATGNRGIYAPVPWEANQRPKPKLLAGS